MALKNSFFVYIATFGSALVLYHLGWSDIYPTLSYDVWIFFGLTFLSALILGLLISPAIDNTWHYQPGMLPRFTGVFVVLIFLAEIFLTGGIPLLMIVDGANFNKLEAGTSHLHLFFIWSVYSTIRFTDFLYARRGLYLIEAMLPVLLFGLLAYRGPAIICVSTWFFIFVIWCGELKLRHIVSTIAAAAMLFYLNGLIGDIRSPGQESIGAPSESFAESNVPKIYFWTYLYSTVSIANFQLNVNELPGTQGTITEFIFTEMLPTPISRIILPVLNKKTSSGNSSVATRDLLYSWKEPQVAKGLNISTLFGRSYGYFGWLGPVIMFAALTFFIIMYLMLCLRSPYRVPCIALLNTFVVFCLFTNMIVSTAILLPLIFPLLIPPWRAMPKNVKNTK